MKQNIITIKNILRIIISVLLIGTMIKSCAKAYTNEDLSNFIDQLLVNENVNSNTRTYASTLKNRLNTLFNYMETNNIYLENYKGISIYSNNSGGYYPQTIYFIPNDSTISFSNNYYYATNVFWIYFDKWGYINNTGTSSQSIATSGSFSYSYFGLLDGLINLNNNMYFENYFTPTILFDYTPVFSVASGDFTYIKINYVSNFIPLGVLGSNEYYQLDAKFRDELSMKNLFNWSDVPGTRLYIE